MPHSAPRNVSKRASTALPFLALLFSACTTTSIYVPVTFPADFHLENTEVLIVSAPEWKSDSSEFERFLKAEFSPRFLRTLKAAFPEKSIGGTQRSSGGGELILHSAILQASYNEWIASVELYDPDKTPARRREQKALAQLAVQFSLFDANRKLIHSDVFLHHASVTNRIQETSSIPLSKDSLFEAVTDEVLHQFISATKERKETAVVSFFTDSRFPEIANGIRAAKQGKWSDAITIFRSVTQRSVEQDGADKHWFNLGIAYQYALQFRDALACFERARELNASKRYDHAIEGLLDMERRTMELYDHRRN